MTTIGGPARAGAEGTLGILAKRVAQDPGVAMAGLGSPLVVMAAVASAQEHDPKAIRQAARGVAAAEAAEAGRRRAARVGGRRRRRAEAAEAGAATAALRPGVPGPRLRPPRSRRRTACWRPYGHA